jgi:signal transduction histidine kinase
MKAEVDSLLSFPAHSPRLWLTAGLAFACALCICVSLLTVVERLRQNERRQAIGEVANLNAREISDRLERALSASFALGAIVRQGSGRVDNFESLAEQMISAYGGIGALQLAPGGTISKVVPLTGNEKAVGFNPLKDPKQKFEAQRAVDNRGLALTGPFPLIQGGFGVVGRYPVFLPDAQGGEAFWGLVQVVIRIPELLAVTSLGALEISGYRYELWRIDPQSGERSVFSRSSSEPLKSPVDTIIHVPDGQWVLSVEPGRHQSTAVVLIAGGLISLLVSLLVAGGALLLQRESALLRRENEERRIAQAELQHSAGLLHEILDTMDSGIVLWNRDQQLVAWNREFEQMFPAVAHALYPGMTRATLLVVMQAAGDFPAEEQQVANDWNACGVWDRLLSDGRIFELQRLATSDGGRLVLHSDVTDVRRTNQVLARNDRMASLGKLVAGIAHEINTPIGNAMMVASSVHQRVQEMEALVAEGPLRRSALDSFMKMVRESDDILLRNLSRAADLIQHFKQVAVDQTSDRRREFDLATVLDEVAATLMPGLRRSTHSLRLDLAPGVVMDSYPGALGQIVTNFVENSLLHAFPERSGGVMSLVAGALDDTRVEIIYSDDGVGVPAAHLARVFDPFYTTKLGQGGSGLGLSIVLNLVHDLLGGELVTESREHEGVTFRLILPRIAPRVPHSDSP